MGSSPRLRGTRCHPQTHTAGQRIIPALAGNTSLRGSGYVSAGDHPRACGEHPASARHHCVNRGSSPRLRGTREHESVGVPHGGIIPALAGNTNSKPVVLPWLGDHPRACGEHDLLADWPYGTPGSSPRLRGTRLPPSGHFFRAGIIPALAGNTRRHDAPSYPARDHPRACGEHPSLLIRAMVCLGSSPRLRGTPRTGRSTNRSRGIIPALAGNTTSVDLERYPVGDHPRACGEHVFSRPWRRPGRGSSPRLRGTPRRPRGCARQRGIIPALAGNTL